ncbi:MAG: 3'-5' exonuclease [Bdellovibrionales bacterium]|nr:3'-5' exonuclease [Bdellovibrionales bacterium]
MLNLQQNWSRESFIAFDTETSGKYPIESEICEIAAVKWQKGQIVAKYNQLIKTSQPMDQEVINIHNITNEMLAKAPKMTEVVDEFANFIADSYLVAHHAPFDLGFLAIEFEKKGLQFPERPVICSSLLSRKVFPNSPNHKLQTLIKYLNLSSGQAHRALDDSIACLELTLKCFEKLGPETTLQEILELQGGPIWWKEYALSELKKASQWNAIFMALDNESEVYITYEGGSKPGRERCVLPKGIIRSARGDQLVAMASGESLAKRYFFAKISASRLK